MNRNTVRAELSEITSHGLRIFEVRWKNGKNELLGHYYEGIRVFQPLPEYPTMNRVDGPPAVSQAKAWNAVRAGIEAQMRGPKWGLEWNFA